MKSRCGIISALAVASVLLVPTGVVTAAPADTTRVRMVEVELGVRLETLDWGGSGPQIVLLADVGNTAHIYEDFGRSLAAHARVFGLTRRGFGSSTHANGGYAPRDLARDVATACDSLGVVHPILIGHGLAGSELAWFAARYPGRARALIYLDAAYDHSLIHEMEDLAPKPELSRPKHTDLRSLRAVQAWLLRTRGFATPVSELKALYAFGADGRVVDMTSSPLARGLLLDALATPPFSRATEPVLAIFVKPTVSSLYPDLAALDAENRQLVGPRVRLRRQLASAAIATFEKGLPGARVLVWTGVNHHLFLTETTDVLAAVLDFVDALPSPE